MSKVDLTKEYKTRDGREVNIYEVYLKPVNVVHGAHRKNGTDTWCLYGWNGDGTSNVSSHLDLIEVKPVRKIDGWMNMYEGFLMLTKKEADKCAGPNRIACVHIVQEYEEGEGL